MLEDLDLTFYPYLNSATYWQALPSDTSPYVWLWTPATWFGFEATLDHITRLTAAGWERVPGRYLSQMDMSLYHFWGQLADLRTMERPGYRDDRELWARGEDLRRVHDMPVALAFTAPTLPQAQETESGTMLTVAQPLPPPQFGEVALIETTREPGERGWQRYNLSELGEEGLELWRQLGTALKNLAAPAQWWPHTRTLEACLHGQYAQLREELRSKLLATSRSERELWRERLAQLERDRKHVQAIQTARERARKDPAAWLEQWQEIRRMAQELAALYWQAHITATSIPATLDSAPPVLALENDTGKPVAAEVTLDPERAAEVAILEQIIPQSSAAGMLVHTHAEDRAAREASLAPSNAWEDEGGVPRYKASNNLAVYFLDREHPLSIEEAKAQLLTIREGTVLTMRIAQGLWNLRRHNGELTKNGSVGILYDEILDWRGVKKHTQAARPGSDQRVTDGHRAEDREELARDFALASRYYIQGERTVYSSKGKPQRLVTKGHYIDVSFVNRKDLWGNEHPLGVFYHPGDWINAYTESGNVYLADVDRRVFQLNPQNEQHELKLALYLIERWREQANDADYGEPITMAELLRQSVITVDRTNLTSRFAPRIEGALENLRRRGIIGALECLTPADRTKARWGNGWLASRWRILPPANLRQSYVDNGITQAAPALPPRRTGRPRKVPQNGQ